MLRCAGNPKPAQIAADARNPDALAAAGKGDAKDDARADAKTLGKTAPDQKSPGDPPAGKTAKNREERGRLWVKDGVYVRPIDVQIGISDGTNTEVDSPDFERRPGRGPQRLSAR